MDVYVIGGSPCSGKSTVAQTLSEKFGLHYFKVDDRLDRYLQAGAAEGKPCCARIAGMSPDQIWMRDPQEQCEEELLIYQEIAPFILADLQSLETRSGVITEGAAYLPVLARQYGLPFQRYLSLTPSKEFQVSHYRRREWVPHVLAGCSDPAKAFENWMERDALFAQTVQQQCRDAGYVSIVNQGSASIDEMLSMVSAHFALV